MGEILRAIDVVVKEFGMEISEVKASVVRFNRKWKCGGWQVYKSGAAKYLGMSVVGGVGGGFIGVSGRMKMLTRVLGMVKSGAKRVDRSARNAVLQGESGWRTFEERQVKAKMAFVRKILWGGILVAVVERAALLEIGLSRGGGRNLRRWRSDFIWMKWRRRVSETGKRSKSVKSRITLTEL
ncbi:hypothetical protein CAPTEDRAFT_213854 [Capitella teleta]|uniref:Uncharacterized protein n=1 Tax=Capitella teleta TaxID=283909 RepID=R7U361_CAPTE|nr:hypothetical protein CAPTEDRAFT_213854 [Capitella teleta]|eukprot:ELU00780.1 hypothetical protein CAPTEDRAFT_213854 [Capitella teleta]